MNRIIDEKNKLINNTEYDFNDIYDMILNKKLYFNEIGGFLKNKKFISKTKHINYDFELDKPYYVFDFTKMYFKNNHILWHIHPYQGDTVWNCYPSFPDLHVMSQNPGKIFILITKCGTFIYFSKLKRFILSHDEYEYMFKNFFYDYNRIIENNYINTDNFVILYYDKRVPTHEHDFYTNLKNIIKSIIL